MAFTQEQILKILKSGEFENFIGEIENDFLECKSGIYLLKNEKNKRELAKDVASLANSNGGIILFGVKTKPSLEHIGDEIDSISPMTKGKLKSKQYFDILDSWIYPKINDLTITWFPMKTKKRVGIYGLQVPKQAKERKPFLIKKCIEGEKIIEIMFGFTERRRDNCQPTGVIDIQKLIRLGLNYDFEINSRFDNIEAQINQINSSIKFSKLEHESNKETKEIESKIEMSVKHNELNKGRAFV
ncbi:MAG: AlbA family DNA-binding domain-containing protein, partial [Candidatus Zixiibacteriota bacterium]